MGQIELDRPSAACLEVDEQRPPVGTEQVARVRLAVQQLLDAAVLADQPAALS